jgi:hypothetical protein
VAAGEGCRRRGFFAQVGGCLSEHERAAKKYAGEERDALGGEIARASGRRRGEATGRPPPPWRDDIERRRDEDQVQMRNAI